MNKNIIKRDGVTVPFQKDKITKAIYKAAEVVSRNENRKISNAWEIAGSITDKVVDYCDNNFGIDTLLTVEQIQDVVEKILIREDHAKTAKVYIIYRNDRTRARDMKTNMMKVMRELSERSNKESDMKRENANIAGDEPMAQMLRYGEISNNEYMDLYILEQKHTDAHKAGDIHIHDKSWTGLTLTCCQIDLMKLFKDGFNTGHGHLREPNSISVYSSLACIALQANQNMMHGGQSIHAFDYFMAPGITKSFWKNFEHFFSTYCELKFPFNMEPDESDIELIKELSKEVSMLCKKFSNEKIFINTFKNEPYRIFGKDESLQIYSKYAWTHPSSDFDIDEAWMWSYEKALELTDKQTYQAMEGFIHNMNTMHSRAGAQVPFSSINYGTDTSFEGRMVIKNILLATEAGLGHNETAIWPVQIFKTKDGINFNPGDTNYDLFQLACRVSAKRQYPNFSFLDAPFNIQYYKEGDYNSEIAYMGCRTRVIGNVYDPDQEVIGGRGNISFTTINLPRLAIRATHVDKENAEELFFKYLDEMLELVCEQLYHRYCIIAQKKVKNFPFLMGEGIWLDSDKLAWEDTIGDIVKHGTQSCGFIGLAEALTCLRGFHHGESIDSQELGLKIVKYMRDFLDRKAQKTKMNYTLLATPAEGLSSRFTKLDKEKFGIIPGVTDKMYYTNSSHIPVGYKISSFDKIRIEAEYHQYENAGHILYVEIDGDISQNLEAFENIIRTMKNFGVGYGAISHPTDRDPVCGYNGVIRDKCPGCGREVSDTEYEMIIPLE